MRVCWLHVRDVMREDMFNFAIQILKREHHTDQLLESNSDLTKSDAQTATCKMTVKGSRLCCTRAPQITHNLK